MKCRNPDCNADARRGKKLCAPCNRSPRWKAAPWSVAKVRVSWWSRIIDFMFRR